jgi:threonine dehydrogenase-like Zn-dependent dehydrogenase
MKRIISTGPKTNAIVEIETPICGDNQVLIHLKYVGVCGGFPGFDAVMEWAETDESLDLAINLTKECGQLCVGAYHTGGKRFVDVQQLGAKAIEFLNTHPRETELSILGCKNGLRMLESGMWKFTNVPTKIFPMGKFDEAHAELETKYGSYMKAVIDMRNVDGEAYIV